MSSVSTRPYHAFLSYSHKDRDVAVKLHRWLTRDAVKTVNIKGVNS